MKLRTTLFVLAIALSGCESTKTQHDAATSQWKAARASVQSSLAKDQFNSGNLDTARSTVNEALRLVPENAELRVLSARIAIEKGQLDLADSELKKAGEADPKNGSVDYYRGIVLQRWQQHGKALDAYTAACEKNPKELPYLLARAETLVALEQSADAIALLQSATVEFENAPALRGAIGQLLIRDHRPAEAVDVLRKAVLLGPEDESHKEQLARALFLAHRYPEAIEAISTLLRSETFKGRADLFAALGQSYLSNHNPRLAKPAFETATNLQPQNTTYLVLLAEAALQSNDLRRAELSARRALTIDADLPRAHLILGLVRQQQAQLPEALTSFARAAELSPKDALPLILQSQTLHQLNRPAEAAPLLARAIALDPSDNLAKSMLTSLDMR